MIVALYVFAYILIGWIVASACLTMSIRNNNKTELSSDFLLPFCLWPFVLIGFAIGLIGMIIMWLGRITEKVISKLMQGENK